MWVTLPDSTIKYKHSNIYLLVAKHFYLVKPYIFMNRKFINCDNTYDCEIKWKIMLHWKCLKVWGITLLRAFKTAYLDFTM